MTVAEVLGELEDLLGAGGVATPRVDAEWMLRHVTGWSRAQLLTSADRRMPAEDTARLREMGRRRAAREPLQLILGTVGFRYLDLEVRAGVFVPRPETEVLAGEAIVRVPPGGIVVEPCTGTGAVACAVASEAAPAAVVATDVSAEAVALAGDNAVRCGVEILVSRGDLLGPVASHLRGRVDVLVSNPPYLAQGELPALDPEVAGWDPYGALVAGPTGHEVSDRLIAAAAEWLAPSGWLLLEVADVRAGEAAARAASAGLVDVVTVADLAGRQRIVAARAPREGADTPR